MKQQDYHYTITAKMPAEEAFEKINRVSHWVDEERFYWPVTKVGDTFTVHLRRETCVEILSPNSENPVSGDASLGMESSTSFACLGKRD